MHGVGHADLAQAKSKKQDKDKDPSPDNDNNKGKHKGETKGKQGKGSPPLRTNNSRSAQEITPTYPSSLGLTIFLAV